MTEFAHLAVHSSYSFMRGSSSMDALCRAAVEKGMDRLALTDLNGVYGAVWFWDAAKEAGLKPILGADVIEAGGQTRAVLLVKEPKGWSRLCRILTNRHLANNRPAGCGPTLKCGLPAMLIEDRDGLVILSSDMDLLGELVKNGVTDDVYVALSPGVADERKLIAFAHEARLKLVATGDVYFAEREGYELHRLLRAIDLNSTLSRVKPGEFVSPKSWLTSKAEMAARYPHVPEALKNAWELAERVSLKNPPWGELIFPAFNGLTEEGAYRMLVEKSFAGARKRYGRVTDAVRKRLEHELKVIREKGFATYFLVVEDIVSRFPRTCGRGSAAASIVSYSLGITHVEPIRHNLFFERFLNPGREVPPDIDVDFPWDERDGVLDYVFDKYGDTHAAMVSNHVCFRARAAVHEIAKVFGLPEDEITRVTKKMKGFWRAEGVERLVAGHPLFRGLDFPDPWPQILKTASVMEGVPRHLSVHCGGVVIVPGRVDNYVPVERAPKGVNIIQWEKDQTEDAGLIKIDLLGNRSLAVIRDALSAVNKSRVGAQHASPLQYDQLNPLDDEATQACLARGDSVGVFYVESPAMRQLQKKTRRGDFEHLVIHSSIIRPAANNFIREYVRRLHGGKYEPLHPALEETLSDTYGIMCYQEDVTKVAMALGGFDPVSGDDLRKNLSRKRAKKKMSEYRQMFFAGAKERGVEYKTVEAIWEMILSFGGYSFCKPHSASYALVSFKSAYLRAHHPAEFMAAVISNQGGYYSTFAYISEARRMGLTILPPDANESDEHYRGQDRYIRIGLMQIKGLTRKAKDGLLGERDKHGPFTSFEDFLARTGINPSDARLLAKAGCFDSIEGQEARPGLLWRIEEYATSGKGDRRVAPTTLSLFEEDRRPACLTGGTPVLRPYKEASMLRHEVETLGFIMSRHPLTLYEPALKKVRRIYAKDLDKYVGRFVTVLGWYVTGKLVATKHGEPMEFLSFEDTTALYETTFFPKTYRRFCHMIDRERPYLLKGRVEEDFGAVSLNVQHVAPLPSS